MGRNGCKPIHSEGTGEGIHHPVQEEQTTTNFDINSMYGIDQQKSCERPANRGAVSGFTGQESIGDCSWSSVQPWLLFHYLYGPKAQWQVPSSYRPQEAQQEGRLPSLQHGRCSESVGDPPSRSFCLFNRSEGCVSTRTSAQKIQEVPQGVQEGHRVSIPCSSVWPLNSSSHIHEDSCRGQTNGTQAGNQHVIVPRRLAPLGQVVRISPGSSQVYGKVVSEPGLDSQSREVRIDTSPRVQVHRCLVELEGSQGLSHKGERKEGVSSDPEVLELSMADSTDVAMSDRFSDSPTKICVSGQTACQTDSVGSNEKLDTVSGSPGATGVCSSRGHSDTSLVEDTVATPPRSTADRAALRHPHLHRCIQVWLGRRCNQQHVQGGLDSGGSKIDYQCIRAESGDKHSGADGLPSTEQDIGRVRQHDGGGLSESSRRDSFLANDERDIPVVSVGSGQGLVSQMSSHPRQVKHHRRRTVKGQPSNTNGVVPTSECSGRDIQDVVQTSSGSVRDSIQQQVQSLCVSSTRRKCNSSGRSISRPRRSGSIRVSSTSNSHETVTKVSDGEKLQTDSHSSVLAKTKMAVNPRGIVSSRTNSASSFSDSSKTTNAVQVSPGTRKLRPPRILVGKRFLMKKGFSERVATKMMVPQCASSAKLYDTLWDKFSDFADLVGFDPFHPTIPQIASFLDKKFEEGQQYRSIGVYRAAIDATLKHHTKLKVGSNLQLSEQIKSYKISRPRLKKTLPQWDLSFVLWSLAHEPFEPIEDVQKVSLELLSWKLLFLLLLASGARRSEIHAVTEKGARIADNGKYAIISPSSEFVAKNEVARGKPLEPFVIRSLEEYSDSDKTLCPVRCLRVYKERTKNIRGRRKKLFISTRMLVSELHINTLSSWIKKLLVHCYSHPGKKAVELSGTGSHEIRRIASTLVFRGVVSIEELLRVGSWKSSSTFTEFYLKDLSVLDGDGLRSLGPISVGQKVIVNTRIA